MVLVGHGMTHIIQTVVKLLISHSFYNNSDFISGIVFDGRDYLSDGRKRKKHKYSIQYNLDLCSAC